MAGKSSVFVDNSTPNVDAAWLNLRQNEVKNLIEDSGQTLSDADSEQESKAAANYAAVSTFYTDSGTVNSYTLTPISNFQSPHAYTDGMLIRFRAGNANTGASTVTVNSLTSKSLKKEDFSTALEAGDIPDNRDSYFRYDSSSGNFGLVINSIFATTTVSGTSYLPNRITIANNTTDSDHDIDFTAGNFTFSGGDGQAVASALTKQLDATWAAGDAAGGLADALTIAADTTYHCFALSNADGSSTDFGFDTSLTAANLLADTAVVAAGLTKYKRIASLVTDGSANIRTGYYKFNPDGSYKFNYAIQLASYSQTNPGTSGILISVDTPSGLNVLADITYLLSDLSFGGSSIHSLLIDGDLGATLPTNTNTTLSIRGSSGDTINGTTNLGVKTDTSSQVRFRISSSDADISVNAMTNGWFDYNL